MEGLQREWAKSRAPGSHELLGLFTGQYRLLTNNAFIWLIHALASTVTTATDESDDDKKGNDKLYELLVNVTDGKELRQLLRVPESSSSPNDFEPFKDKSSALELFEQMCSNGGAGDDLEQIARERSALVHLVGTTRLAERARGLVLLERKSKAADEDKKEEQEEKKMELEFAMLEAVLLSKKLSDSDAHVIVNKMKLSKVGNESDVEWRGHANKLVLAIMNFDAKLWASTVDAMMTALRVRSDADIGLSSDLTAYQLWQAVRNAITETDGQKGGARPVEAEAKAESPLSPRLLTLAHSLLMGPGGIEALLDDSAELLRLLEHKHAHEQETALQRVSEAKVATQLVYAGLITRVVHERKLLAASDKLRELVAKTLTMLVVDYSDLPPPQAPIRDSLGPPMVVSVASTASNPTIAAAKYFCALYTLCCGVSNSSIEPENPDKDNKDKEVVRAQHHHSEDDWKIIEWVMRGDNAQLVRRFFRSPGSRALAHYYVSPTEHNPSSAQRDHFLVKR